MVVQALDRSALPTDQALNIISSFPPLWAYAVEKQELFSNS
jgi:hypothetical protein